MRILLVEDEEKLATSITHGLEKHGHAVDALQNGIEALSRLSLYRNEYDLVILDLMLPGMAGNEICTQARAMDIAVPILILTARDSIDTKVSLLYAGADDYMVKPFSFKELLARIHALLRRPKESIPPTLTVAGITLDHATHSATYKNKTLQLTLKEFVLLEYFMRHPDQALNREEILDHLWDFEFVGFSNIVDVHVKNIRKKLGTNGDRIIQTVRGVGYRLVT